jgi:hypothetical protein
MSEWDLGIGSHRDAEVAESKIIFFVLALGVCPRHLPTLKLH